MALTFMQVIKEAHKTSNGEASLTVFGHDLGLSLGLEGYCINYEGTCWILRKAYLRGRERWFPVCGCAKLGPKMTTACLQETELFGFKADGLAGVSNSVL